MKKHDEVKDNDELIVSAQALEIDKALVAGIRFEPKPYICPECGESFHKNKQLNGHISAHKYSKEWQTDLYTNWELENNNRVSILKSLDMLTTE